MKRITAKLGNMRKPQDFIVYPQSGSTDVIIVQSDKSIGMFDPDTGKGKLNTRGNYFPHLHYGQVYQFPKEFVKECIEAQPKPGDLIGSSPITGPVYAARQEG